MRSLARQLAVVAAAALLGACSACDGAGPAVPFGLDGGRGTAAAPSEPEEGHRADPARRDGRAFPEGTRRVDLEGAPIMVEGSIRALWASDVDGDGDRDGVLVVSGPPEAPIRIVYSQRDGSAFVAPRVLASAPAAPEGCTIARSTLSPLGRAWLVARAALACEAHPESAREELWVLGTDRAPRVLEHLAVLSETERAPGAVTLELSAEDRDEDGREDLRVRVGVAGEQLDLPWLDRTSGLAREAAEPDRTFIERSRAALRRLRAHPDQALAGSRAVLASWEALCRESGRARLRVGGTEGIGCGRSDGAGRAATTIVRALAGSGELLAALDAYETLERDGLLIDEERRDYARRAIADAPPTPGVTLREGPAHAAPRWDAIRLSALAFVDEDHVLLRGAQPRVWDIAAGAEEPAAVSGELRILDPSGAYAVTGIERRCDGHVLSIVAQQGFVAGSVFGATHSAPLLIPRAPPAGAPCPSLSAALRDDDGGWRVLGWAPQGVVAARGAELRVVPLDVSAQPAGAPEALDPGTPPPAPLAAGTATSDGRWVAELRGIGVLVHRILPRPATEVLWPAGWSERDGVPTDVAVSPSGRRVAVLRGGRVLLLERAP